jgi:thiaminase
MLIVFEEISVACSAVVACVVRSHQLRLTGTYDIRLSACLPPVHSQTFTAWHLPLLLLLQTSVAEVLAAMIPCARLYGFLGCQLAAAIRGQPRHAYSEWVETYSGAEYLVRTV